MSHATFGQGVAHRPAITPIGHAIAQSTPVMTLDGSLPVEFLSPGDRVLTRAGVRKLVAVEMAVVQNARLVRISEGTLGKDRPADDLLVSPDQTILVRDWRAPAIVGREQALIAADRLVDGEYIRRETHAEARLFTLRFEEDAVIYAGGVELACPQVKVSA